MLDKYFLYLIVFTMMLFGFVVSSFVKPAQAEESGIAHRVERLEELVAQLNPTQPINVVVDCDSGESVQAVLNNYANTLGQLNIQVKGMCTEGVYVYRDNTRIYGEQDGDGLRAPSSSSTVVSVEDSADHVWISQLTLFGGHTGLRVSNGADIHANELHIAGAESCIWLDTNASTYISSSLIEQCASGIKSSGGAAASVNSTQIRDIQVMGIDARGVSSVTLYGSTVSNAGFFGVFASENGYVNLHDSTIENNRVGVSVHSNGMATLSFDSIVQNSEFEGVEVFGGTVDMRSAIVTNNGGDGIAGWDRSFVQVGDVVIENNGGSGVKLGNGASAHLGETLVIQGNSGNGVEINRMGVATFARGGPQILDNAGVAVICDPPSVVTMINGTPGVVSGNGSDTIDCPVY
jgi:hypothetical protein